MKTTVPLPTVEGVGPSCLTLHDGPEKHILQCLEERFPDVRKATWIDRMDRGEVVDEKGVRLEPDSPCRKGARIFYYREPEAEIPIPFEEQVLYRDDNMIVADKPHFLAVVPAGRFLRETLLVRLKRKLQLNDLVPIHRIDRDTAGIVIFSHNRETRGAYASLFRERKAEKIYEALAPTLAGVHFPITHGSRIVPGEPFFRMKETEGKANSETVIEILETKGPITLYQLRPLTGKKHQLRLHLAVLGIPIINDRLYPEALPPAPDNFSLPLRLIARSVSFEDPVTGEYRQFQSQREIWLTSGNSLAI